MADAKQGWPADHVERWPIDRLIPFAKNARHVEAYDRGHRDPDPRHPATGEDVVIIERSGAHAQHDVAVARSWGSGKAVSRLNPLGNSEHAIRGRRTTRRAR
jgi:hypothetical protein